MAKKNSEVNFPGVRKRGNKYQWRASFEGMREQRDGYDTPEEAYIARQKWLEEAQRGYVVKPTRDRTLVQLIKESISARNYAPATVKRKMSLLKHHVEPAFKERLAVSITAADIERFLLNLSKPTKDKKFGRDIRYSQEYINGFYKMFSAAFKYGVKQGYIERNPIQLVDHEGDWSSAGIPKEEGKFLKPEELRVIDDTLKSANVYPSFIIGLHTGCRISEIFGLRWSDVDFVKKEISINKQLLYDSKEKVWYISPLKTKHSKRYVPLSPILEKFLLELKQKQKENKLAMGDNYRDTYRPVILENDKGIRSKAYFTDFINVKSTGEWLTSDSTKYATRKREGTTGKYRFVLNGKQISWSYHDLRHTFSTKAALSGVAINDLQRILGHKKPTTTEHYYLHDEEGRLRVNPMRDKLLFAGLAEMTDAINSCPETDTFAEHDAYVENINSVKHETKDDIPVYGENEVSFNNGIAYMNN